MAYFLKRYPVVISLTAVCFLFAVATCLYEGMYDLFAFHSKPVYIWQYFSGTFMHGSKGAPLWFLWVHLFMNTLMLLPFGGVLESEAGSKKTFAVFMAAMLLPAITGWVSTCLHLSGIISGLAVCLLPLPVKSGR